MFLIFKTWQLQPRKTTGPSGASGTIDFSILEYYDLKLLRGRETRNFLGTFPGSGGARPRSRSIGYEISQIVHISDLLRDLNIRASISENTPECDETRPSPHL